MPTPNRVVELLVYVLDVIIGVAFATLSVFSIVYWGRAIYRMFSGRDVWDGHKISKVA